jgi:hypothetical protein
MFWRLVTAPLRVTPDVCILGEVRCGTTTLAAHLASLPGAHPPFCPWTVGFADNKESFYFVGHYWGLVHPMFYRACFPTIFEKWWAVHVMKQPFFTYDACAQYLTAPWVARVLRKAAPQARLVACLRDPVEQSISWWRFENAAMKWAESSLGLGSAYLAERDLGKLHYPPKSLTEALVFSQEAETLYVKAETLEIGGGGLWFLPLWAGTWPGGQLAAFRRNAEFATNIRRYRDYFSPDQLMTIELKTELNERNLLATIQKLVRYINLGPHFEKLAEAQLRQDGVAAVGVKNASEALPDGLEPSEQDRAALQAAYGAWEPGRATAA